MESKLKTSEKENETTCLQLNGISKMESCINHKIEALSEVIKNEIKTVHKRIEDKLSEKTNAVSNTTYANITKQSQRKDISHQHIHDVIQETKKNDKEEEWESNLRSRNIIIHGKNEEKSSNDSDKFLLRK